MEGIVGEMAKSDGYLRMEGIVGEMAKNDG